MTWFDSFNLLLALKEEHKRKRKAAASKIEVIFWNISISNLVDSSVSAHALFYIDLTIRSILTIIIC